MQPSGRTLMNMRNLPAEATITAWARLVKAQRALLERAERDLKEAGLPPLSWYDVLLEVHRAPNHCIRQYEIGDEILLSKYNLSRLLDRMGAEGLIQREACDEDRRGTMVTLRPKGKALLRKMWPIYGRAIQRSMGDCLKAGETRELSGLLAKLIE